MIQIAEFFTWIVPLMMLFFSLLSCSTNEYDLLDLRRDKKLSGLVPGCVREIEIEIEREDVCDGMI